MLGPQRHAFQQRSCGADHVDILSPCMVVVFKVSSQDQGSSASSSSIARCVFTVPWMSRGQGVFRTFPHIK